MKIAIDCRMYGMSGIGTYLRGILPNLIEDKNNYILIGEEKKLNEFLHYPNVKILNCDIPIFSLKEFFLFPLKEINSCDLYYTPNFNIPLGLKIPIYLTIHDMIFWDIPEITGIIGRMIRKLYYKLAYSKANKIFTVSNFSKKRIEKNLGKKRYIKVTYTGISEKFLSKEFFLKKKYILYVGNIKKHKGLKVLLCSFLKLNKKFKDIKLIIVGEQNNFKSKDKEITNIFMNRNENIIFTGYINDDELKRIIGEAKLLIQPSIYEGFGLPPLEAITLGTPALISNIPVFKEIYSNVKGVYFFKNQNVDSLAKEMEEILLKSNIEFEKVDKKYNFREVANRILEEINQV